MSPDEWFNLAWQQQRQGQYRAALASYWQALTRGVEQPEEAHLNRAVILAEGLAKSDAAERELEAALALNPRFVAAWVNLGNLHEQKGERAPARRAYEQALALDPAQPLALSRLPDLRPIAGPDDPLIATLRQAIARPGASAADLADLGFGLGKALDTVGAYDEAFAAYVAANQASRASAGDAAAGYDAPAHERFVDRLIAAFPAPLPADAAAPDATGRIFICGMFRSGSTLVEQILASHPQRHRRRRDRDRAGDRGAPLRALARRLAGAQCREPAEAARRLCPRRRQPPSRRRGRHRQAARQLPPHRPDQGAVPERADRSYAARSGRQLPLGLLPAPVAGDALGAGSCSTRRTGIASTSG